MLRVPWIIHEAEVALFPAWLDGLPFRGPGAVRKAQAPVFAARASLAVSGSRRKTAATGGSWTGADANADGEWEISVSFPDGVMADGVSRLLSRLAPGGFHILVVRFIDQKSGEWSFFQWFYVTVESDELGESGQSSVSSLRLKSTWMQEGVGSATPPGLEPVVRGEVDWVCGSQRITGLAYDPESEAWTSLPRNETGLDGTRYVNISSVEDLDSDIAISAYLPRVVAGAQVAPALPVAAIAWQNQVLARIGNHESGFHHGLTLLGGISLQAAGIVEPLLSLPQSRMLDEPVIVFRYLRRVYATLGHGVLAVPRLLPATDPPFSHDWPFRLAIPGDPNPATGQSGLTLLPNGAWLDGTVVGV